MDSIKKIIIGSLVLLFTGCVSVEKAERVMRAHPKELAKLCADCFPVKESEVVKIDSVFIKGKTVTRTDTVQADCPDGTVVKVKCPECKESAPDTILVNKETKVRDTAYEQVLQDKITELENDNKGLRKWKDFGLWGWGIIGVGLLIFFLKRK